MLGRQLLRPTRRRTPLHPLDKVLGELFCYITPLRVYDYSNSLGTPKTHPYHKPAGSHRSACGKLRKQLRQRLWHRQGHFRARTHYFPPRQCLRHGLCLHISYSPHLHICHNPPCRIFFHPLLAIRLSRRHRGRRLPHLRSPSNRVSFMLGCSHLWQAQHRYGLRFHTPTGRST